MKNKQFSNGRIHGSRFEEAVYHDGYLAFSVSPFDQDFENEIEDGVLPHIKVLTTKGYCPISSCHGHYEHGKWMPWYVMIALGDNAVRQKQTILDAIKNIPGIYTETRKQSANVVNGKTVFGKVDLDKEYEELNKMFLRKNTTWEYLYISLFQHRTIYNKIAKLLFFTHSKNRLFYALERLPYEHIN